MCACVYVCGAGSRAAPKAGGRRKVVQDEDEDEVEDEEEEAPQPRKRTQRSGPCVCVCVCGHVVVTPWELRRVMLCLVWWCGVCRRAAATKKKAVVDLGALLALTISRACPLPHHTDSFVWHHAVQQASAA
jgi:hypothetical protein